jgi:ribonuclease D
MNASEEPVDIRSLPQLRYSSEIVVVDRPEAVESAVNRLRLEALLGFDTETRPVFRKGERHRPALIQLAAPGTVYIFQLRQGGFVPALIGLLSSESPLKAGIGVRDDLKALQDLHPFIPAGFVDLGEVAKGKGIPERGARSLASRFLGGRISKGAQTSNWAARVLTERQKRYAATDAWVCLRLYPLLAEGSL